jgi:hypothetical protein
MSLGIATVGRSLSAITLGNADEIGKRPHVPPRTVEQSPITGTRADQERSLIADSSWINAVRFSIRTHNETLSVVAVCVNNPDRSPARIDG